MDLHLQGERERRERLQGKRQKRGASGGGEVDGASLIVTVAAAGMFLGCFFLFFFGWQEKKTCGTAA